MEKNQFEEIIGMSWWMNGLDIPSQFFNDKSDMAEPKHVHFEKAWQSNKPLKEVQQGNGGESKKLQARTDQASWKHHILFSQGNTTEKSLGKIGFDYNACKGKGGVMPIKLGIIFSVM